MAHRVTCVFCHQTFDRDKIPFVQISKARYAHKECSLTQDEKLSQEEKDKKDLEEYIMKLFNTEYVDPRIQIQIKKFLKDYNYTYSGIKKSLVYFFEIKNNSIEKANGGIGIVPYVYQNAYNYYFSLWQAQQKNETKVVAEYVPTVRTIVIPSPQRSIKKRNNFSFLDEEDVNGK